MLFCAISLLLVSIHVYVCIQKWKYTIDQSSPVEKKDMGHNEETEKIKREGDRDERGRAGSG